MPAIAASSLSIESLETQFGLRETDDRQFFWEWQTDLPDLDEWEQQALDRLKKSFLNALKYPSLTENSVRMVMVHPLLFVGNFYQSPLETKPEPSISIRLEDEENTVIEGRIDVLVLKSQLWLMVIEAKRAEISIEAGIAQLLTYMLANPNRDRPTFGMLTNGSSFLFAKVSQLPIPQSALSDVFVLRRRQNELYDVLKILKRLVQLVQNSN